MPNYGLTIDELYYSEAPLDGVLHAQLCIYGGFCVGLVLQYQSCSRSLGQFRYDKHTSEWFHQPCQIGIAHEREGLTSRVRMNFVTRNLQGKEHGEGIQPQQFHPMTGVMVWWYGKEVSNIQIIPS